MDSVKNYKSGKVVKAIKTFLVCASIAVAAKELPVINGESLLDHFYNIGETQNLQLRAQKALPIELEKGMKREMLGLKFVYPDGKEERIDFEKCKKIYDYNPDICKRQVRVLYNSAVYQWDDCEIISEDGVLMASPVVNIPEKEEITNNVQKLKKTKE